MGVGETIIRDLRELSLRRWSKFSTCFFVLRTAIQMTACIRFHHQNHLGRKTKIEFSKFRTNFSWNYAHSTQRFNMFAFGEKCDYFRFFQHVWMNGCILVLKKTHFKFMCVLCVCSKEHVTLNNTIIGCVVFSYRTSN